MLRTGKTKYLIFDFDGVLADTLAAHLQVRINLGNAKTMSEAVSQMNNYFDNKPVHTRDHTLSDADLQRIKEWHLAFGREMVKLEFGLFEDFIKEIQLIPDKKIAVVSTGVALYVKEKVLSSGLNPTHILTYEDHHSKEEKIERICKDWGVGVKDIFYFTDSKADVYELENFLDRKKIIGCSWGYCGEVKLLTVLPKEQILLRFGDIHKVV